MRKIVSVSAHRRSFSANTFVRFGSRPVNGPQLRMEAELLRLKYDLMVRNPWMIDAKAHVFEHSLEFVIRGIFAIHDHYALLKRELITQLNQIVEEVLLYFSRPTCFGGISEPKNYEILRTTYDELSRKWGLSEQCLPTVIPFTSLPQRASVKRMASAASPIISATPPRMSKGVVVPFMAMSQTHYQFLCLKTPEQVRRFIKNHKGFLNRWGDADSDTLLSAYIKHGISGTFPISDIRPDIVLRMFHQGGADFNIPTRDAELPFVMLSEKRIQWGADSDELKNVGRFLRLMNEFGMDTNIPTHQNYLVRIGLAPELSSTQVDFIFQQGFDGRDGTGFEALLSKWVARVLLDWERAPESLPFFNKTLSTITPSQMQALFKSDPQWLSLVHDQPGAMSRLFYHWLHSIQSSTQPTSVILNSIEMDSIFSKLDSTPSVNRFERQLLLLRDARKLLIDTKFTKPHAHAAFSRVFWMITTYQPQEGGPSAKALLLVVMKAVQRVEHLPLSENRFYHDLGFITRDELGATLYENCKRVLRENSPVQYLEWALARTRDFSRAELARVRSTRVEDFSDPVDQKLLQSFFRAFISGPMSYEAKVKLLLEFQPQILLLKVEGDFLIHYMMRNIAASFPNPIEQVKFQGQILGPLLSGLQSGRVHIHGFRIDDALTEICAGIRGELGRILAEMDILDVPDADAAAMAAIPDLEIATANRLMKVYLLNCRDCESNFADLTRFSERGQDLKRELTQSLIHFRANMEVLLKVLNGFSDRAGQFHVIDLTAVLRSLLDCPAMPSVDGDRFNINTSVETILAEDPKEWVRLLSNLEQIAYHDSVSDNLDVTKAAFRADSGLEAPILRDMFDRYDQFETQVKLWLDSIGRRLEGDDLRTKIKTGLEQALSDGDDLKVLVIIRFALMNTSKFKVVPHHTQMLTVLMMSDPEFSKKQLGQVGTGQGKSMIIAMIAAFKALRHGVAVDVYTTQDILADREVAEFREFFDVLGISVGRPRPRIEGRAHVSYGVLSDFMWHYVPSHQFFSTSDWRPPRQEFAIIDEVDILIMDKDGGERTLTFDANPSLNWVFKVMWDNRHLDNDSIKRLVKRDKRYRGGIGIPGLPSYAKQFLDGSLSDFCSGLRTAEGKDSSKDYRIDTTGQTWRTLFEEKSVEGGWSYSHMVDGITEFLILREGGSEENLNYRFAGLVTTYESIIRGYGPNLLGLSGSLGIERERRHVSAIYGIKTYQVPLFTGKRDLMRLAPEVIADAGYWAHLVKKVEDASEKGIPVLIVMRSEHDATQLKAALLEKNAKLPVKLFTGESTPEQEEVIHNAGRCHTTTKFGMITCTTIVGGRGVDIKPDRTLNEKGGMLVLMGFLPLSARIQTQIEGRAARQDNKGQFGLIISESELSSFSKTCGYSGRVELIESEEIQEEKERKAKIFWSEIESARTNYIDHTLEKSHAKHEEVRAFAEVCMQFRDFLQDRGRSYESVKNEWVYWLDFQRYRLSEPGEIRAEYDRFIDGLLRVPDPARAASMASVAPLSDMPIFDEDDPGFFDE